MATKKPAPKKTPEQEITEKVYKKIADAEKRIVVLQQGWVLMGNITPHATKPDQYRIENGSVIRKWGTTRGLGEIAIQGPTSETILDEFGSGEFPRLAVLFFIDCQHKTAQ